MPPYRAEPDDVGSGGGFEGDFVAHGFELGDESSLVGRAVAALVEVVAAEVGEGFAGGH